MNLILTYADPWLQGACLDFPVPIRMPAQQHRQELSAKLKGSHLALFAVLKSLGLTVKVLPILEGE